MLNLSDKELDRLSKEAAQEYEPGEVLGAQSWEKLEIRLDRDIGGLNPNPLRHVRRFPFYYAPAALLVVLGVSYYLFKKGGGHSGSPPAALVQTPKTSNPSSKINPELNDESTSTPAASSTASSSDAAVNGASRSDAGGSAGGAAASGSSTASGTSRGSGNAVSGASGAAANGGSAAAGRDNVATGRSAAGGNAAAGSAAGRKSATAGSGAVSRSSAVSGSGNTAGNEAIAAAGGNAGSGNGAGSASNAVSGAGANGIAGASGARSNGAATGNRLNNRNLRANSRNRRVSNRDRHAGNANLSTGGQAGGATGNQGTVAGQGITAGRASTDQTLPQSGGHPGRTGELGLTTIQGLQKTKKGPYISDSALRAFTLKSTAPELVHQPGLRINRSLQFGVVLAPDYASVNSLAGDKAGSTIGLTVDYNFANRWYIGTGLLLDRKNYAANAKDYHAPPDFYRSYNMHNLDYVKGTFEMLEIPLNLRYDFSVTGNTLFFASTGISSYLLTSENNNYYSNPWGPRLICQTIPNPKTGNYLFSAVTLSVGVETGLSNSLSLLIAPYVKMPTRNIGFGEVQMNTVGINFALKFAPVISRHR